MEQVKSGQKVNAPLTVIEKDNQNVTSPSNFRSGNSSGLISKTRLFGAWLTGGAPAKPASNDVKMLTVFGTHTF